MSTQQSTPTAADSERLKRLRRARYQSFDVERIAPGMFEVERYGSDTTHTVDIRGPACSCEDFQYTVGTSRRLDECKHIMLIRQISRGVCCAHCTYPTCRPSCPQRGEQ
jgi:hypothetical protein